MQERLAARADRGLARAAAGNPDRARADDPRGRGAPAHPRARDRADARRARAARGAAADRRRARPGGHAATRARSAGPVDLAGEHPAEQLFQPTATRARAHRGRRPSPRRRPRADRRGPRSRRFPSRAARRGNRRARPPTRRARSRRLRGRRPRWRTRCSACCGSARRPCRRARPPAPSSARTCLGVATPIVSARTTSSASRKRSASASTAPGSTGPSNGQPNATLIVTVAGRSAAARIRSTRAAASSTDAFAFRCENDSVAASVTLTPVERGRLQPLVALLVQARGRSTRRPLEARSPRPPPRRPPSAARRSSRTKLTASILCSPAPASRFTRSARTDGASTSGSFCSPSRGPTSQRITSRNRTR